MKESRHGARHGVPLRRKLRLRTLIVDLLILDELGYLPFSQVGRALLFHLLSKLYEMTKT
jgi:DNA replication protein DnaC